jgi:hypothetical protein
MSQDGQDRRPEKGPKRGQEKGPERAAEQFSDESLRALLESYDTPSPSSDFVSDMLLKIQLPQYEVPEPSPGFVGRLLARLEARHQEQNTIRFPMALAALGFAAALLLAFFIGRPSTLDAAFSNQAMVRIEDFPARGSNGFARSLSLVVDRVDSRFLSHDDGHRGASGEPAYPRPLLSLPAPPMNLLPSSALETYADRATLESLGVIPGRL